MCKILFLRKCVDSKRSLRLFLFLVQVVLECFCKVSLLKLVYVYRNITVMSIEITVFLYSIFDCFHGTNRNLNSAMSW